MYKLPDDLRYICKYYSIKNQVMGLESTSLPWAEGKVFIKSIMSNGIVNVNHTMLELLKNVINWNTTHIRLDHIQFGGGINTQIRTSRIR